MKPTCSISVRHPARRSAAPGCWASIWVFAFLALADPLGGAEPASQSPAPERGKLPVQLFEPEEFGGSSTFTSVVQGGDGIVYGACRAGITEFDGARWRLIEPPSAPLSLAADAEGTVYVGCQGDFGRLAPDDVGLLKYESLKQLLPQQEQLCGDIERVVATDLGVFFLSQQKLFHLPLGKQDAPSGQTLHVYETPPNSNCLGVVDDTVVVGVGGDFHRLLEFDGQGLTPIPGSDSIEGYIIDVIRFDRDRLLVATNADGLFLCDRKRSTPFQCSAGRYAQRRRTWRLLPLPGGEFAMATQTGGLAVFDHSGEITRIIDRDNDLPSNQVMGLAREAVQPGIWLATGHGLARVDVSSPVQFFDADLGVKDVVLDLAEFNDRLYISTNAGLYVLQASMAAGKLSRFAVVDESEGDRRALLVVKDELLVGGGGFGGLDVVHDSGEIERLTIPGYIFGLVASRDGDVVYAPSVYDGVQLLAKRGGRWSDLGSIPGTSRQVERLVESPGAGRLWISARTEDGTHRMERVDWQSIPAGGEVADDAGDPRLDAERVSVRAYGQEQGLRSRWKFLPFVWRDVLFVSSPDGVFRYDADLDRFVVSTEFTDSAATAADLVTQRGYLRADVDERQALWFSDPTHRLARQTALDAEPDRVNALRSLPRKHIRGLYAREGDFIWASTTDGSLIRFDPSLEPESSPPTVPLLREVRSPRGEALPCGRLLNAEAPSLPFSHGTLGFDFALPRYTFGDLVRYRYRLVGLNDEWSEWTAETHHEFTALPEGAYRFDVAARDELMRISPIASYSFVVQPPWYRTWWSYVMYAAIAALAIVGWVRMRVRRARRQIAQLELEVANRTQELRDSEAAVREARDDLEQRVEARTAELREREERFRTLCEHAPVGILLNAAAGNCTYANPLCCELLGRTAEACMGSGWSDAIHPEDRAAVDAAWSEAVAAHSALTREIRFRRPDGGVKHVLFHAVPRLDQAGEVVGWIGTLLDLTDRLQAEETLDEQQAMLAHVARLSTMGEFVAEIAHEVNQPLHSIVNYAEATSNVLASNNGNLQKLNEWNRAIVESAQRAAEIIKRLRRFVSRSESERFTADVNELVRESIELVAFEARRKQAVVEAELQPGLMPVLIDRVQIQQVLVNLLRNAYEAMEESDAARRVRIRTAQSNGDVQVTVSDTGPGVWVADQDIFAAFVTTKPNGMGMGLAISKTIVDAHGGRLWVDSSEGGASFHIALPAARQCDTHKSPSG